MTKKQKKPKEKTKQKTKQEKSIFAHSRTLKHSPFYLISLQLRNWNFKHYKLENFNCKRDVRLRVGR